MAPSPRTEKTPQTRPTTAVGLAVALVGAVMLALLNPIPASAELPGVDPDEHPPYTCDGSAFLMLNGTYSTVTPDPDNPGIWLVSALPAAAVIGNSLGYDPTTDYVYGTRGPSDAARVETYDANGSLVNSVPLAAPYPHGASVYSGTVLGDGTYIIGTWGKNNADQTGWYAGNRYNLWAADAQTGAVTHIGSVPRSEADFSYNPLDGYLYHASSGTVTRWDPRTGAEVRIPVPDWTANGFGGSWFDSAGNLYVYKNKTGEIFQIADPGGSPSASLVGTASSAGGVDATSCVGEVDLLKDVVDEAGAPVPLDERNYRPGEVVTYAFTMINNAIPTGPQPLTVCDSLGDGRTFTGGFSDPTGTASFDSPLVAGATSMCMTVDVPSSLWTDPYTPGGEPVTVTVDVQIPEDFVPGEYANQAWLDRDGNRSTPEVFSDDPGDLTDGEDPTTVNVTGTLQVSKDVAGHPTDDGADSFAFTIACTTTDGASHDVAASSIVAAATTSSWPRATTNGFSLSNGEAIDIWDLPAGATCVTTEAAGPYYPISSSNDAGSSDNTDNTSNVIDAAPGVERAQFSNYTSTFTVAKTTKLPSSDYDLSPRGAFDILVECKSPSGAIYSATHTISIDTTIGSPPAGGTGETVTPPIPLLPHETSCTVTEDVPTGWELAESTGSEFTTSVKEVHAVRFTNVRQLADLTIGKEIVGLPDDADPADFAFKVTVTCEGDAFATAPNPFVAEVTTNSPIVLKGLPVGASCLVEEAPDPAFFATYSSEGGKVEIAPEGSKVLITNTTGTLIVKKDTVVTSDHPINANGTFTFDIDCNNGRNAVYSGTHTLTTDTTTATGATGGIGYDELPLLPPGTTCKISERDPGTEWNQLPNDNAVVITVEAENPQTAEFTNERLTADLTVVKDVVGAPAEADLGEETFDVTATCTGDFLPEGKPYVIADLTVSEAEDLVIKDLPIGSTCVVTEAADERFATTYTTDGKTTSSDGGKVAIETGGTKVGIFNTTSWFEIEKTTQGNGVDRLDLDGEFTFAVRCEGPGGELLYEEKVTVATFDQAGSLSPTSKPALPLVPPGSVCVVEEAQAVGWSVVGDNPQKVETSTDGGALSFVNERQVANLTITKTIDGLPKGFSPDDYTFDLAVTCSGGFASGPHVENVTVTPGTDLVVSGVPVGSTCSVVEADQTDFTVAYKPSSVRMTPTGAAIEVINSTGSFSITKTAAGPQTNGLDLSETFDFSVACERPDASVYAAVHSVTTGGGTDGVATSSTATPQLPIFPPNTTCTITEQPAGASWSAVSAKPVELEITSHRRGEASFVNRRNVASLTVTKTLLGVPDGADWADDEFTVDISCSGDFLTGTLELRDVVITANSPAVVADLPTGAVCSVTEDADPRFAASYGPAAPDGQSGLVTIADAGSTVDVVNATSNIIVVKQTTVEPGHPTAWNDTFEFAVVCTNPGGAVIYDNVHTVATSTATAGGGLGSLGRDDLPSLPAGTNCTVAEQNLPIGWTLSTENNLSATITPDGAQTISFTNSRNVADLTVAKTIDGLPTELDADDFDFTVDVSCTGPFTISPYVIEDLALSTGSDLVIADLPTGATCSVVEDDDARFSPAYSPTNDDGEGASITVADGGNIVDITNSTGTLGIRKIAVHAGDQNIDVVETFNFAVVCDNGTTSAHTVTTDGTGDNVGTGDSVIPPLPLLAAGTLCTVTEQRTPTGWTLDSDPSVELTIAADTPATAVFTNSRDTADLTITKTLFGIPDGEDLNDELFAVDVACLGDFSSSPFLLGGQSVSVNQPLVVPDLPTGAVCTVVEEADDRFDSTYSASSVSISDEGATFNVINTTGELLIKKFTEVSSSHPVDLVDTFDFAVVCTNAAGDEIYNQTLQITTAATSATTGFGAIGYDQLPLLPNGASCTVSESVPVDDWTLQSANDLDVTIAPDDAATAEFTNVRQTGDLTITKTLLGVPDGQDLSSAMFDVAVSCIGDFITDGDDPYLITSTVSDASDLVITDLPTGAACTVVEDPGPLFSVTVVPADGTATVTADDSATVDLTNSTGELAISKTTVVTGTHPIDPTGVFSFNIACDNGPTPYEADVEVTVDTVTDSGAWGGLGLDDLPLLPAGTTCEVTETAVPQGWTVTSEDSVELTITSDGPETASFINTRDTTSLTISKVLDGVPDHIDLDDEEFDITVSCTGDFIIADDDPDTDLSTEALHEMQIAVSVNEPVTIEDLPTLAACTVLEAEDERFTATYEQPSALDNDGEEAVVTNTTGTFTVAKTTAVNTTHPVAVDATFGFDTVCVGPGGTILFDSTVDIITDDAAGAWGVGETPLLPRGTTCSVTEVPVDGWSLTDRTGGELIGEDTISFVVGDEITEITFANERDTADLTITKALAGVPADQDLSQDTFEVAITCVGGFGLDENGTEIVFDVSGPLTVDATSDLTIEALPVGTDCRVVEDADYRFVPTYTSEQAIDDDGSHVTVGIDGASIDIVNTTGHLVLIKNTTSGSAQPINLSGDFTFDVACDNGYRGSHVISVDAPVSTGMVGAIGAEDLPLVAPGVSCDITETDLPPGWTINGEATITVVIGEGATEVGFENIRSTADLTITKVVSRVPGSMNMDDENFSITVTCTGALVNGSHTINSQVSVNTPAVISGLPTSADCLVAEDVDPTMWTAGYLLDGADSDGRVSITGDQPAAITINNVYGGSRAISGAGIDGEGAGNEVTGDEGDSPSEDGTGAVAGTNVESQDDEAAGPVARPQPQAQGGALAFTGAGTARLLAIAFVLIGLGMAVISASRRSARG